VHDCRSSLCDTPHYANDSHKAECLCALCHPEHEWSEWNCYPDFCDGCLMMLAQWIHENTDFTGCPIPEVCNYSKACQIQYPNRRVA